MSIKKIFLFIFLFFLSKNLVFTMTEPQIPGPQSQDKDMPPIPSPEEIENIMKDPEFMQMMKELEEIFRESEDDNKPVEKVEPKIEPKSIEKDTKIGEAKINAPKKSLTDNFLDPVKQDDKDKYSKDTLIKKLPKEKVEAFYYFINKLTKALNNIESKINSFNLGIAFKEQMQELGLIKLFNQIDIAIAQLKSKKMYLKVFYLPMYTDLRQKILDTLKTVEKIEQDLLNLKPESKNAESEVSDFEYLKKIAEKKSTKKSRLDLNLTPLQENLKRLLNSDLKNIKTKIDSVIKSSQVKEEIDKKIGKRKQLEKDAASKSKPGRGYSPGYPRYGSSYPDYSGRGRGYDDYGSRSRYPGSGYSQPYKPTPKDEPSKIEPERTKEPEKKDKNLSSKYDDKTQKKLAKINTLGEESLKLIHDIKTLYKDGTFQDIDKVYKSEKLSQLNDKIIEINNTKKDLNIKTKTNDNKKETKVADQQTLTPKLDSELKGHIAIFIPLANNPGQEKEVNSAQEILKHLESSNAPAIKIEFAKYEDKIINSLKNKERELKSFGEPAKNLGAISRNIEILNNLRKRSQADLDKIDEVNKRFKQALGDEIEFEELKNDMLQRFDTADEIKRNLGTPGNDNAGVRALHIRNIEDVNVPGLDTQANVLATITNSGFPDKIKEALTKATREILKEPVPGVAAPVITENEKKDLKLKFSKIINNYKKQKDYLEKIYNLVKTVEQDEED
ncbi:MAG: hypothetical protein SZ59_C0001G0081 [candidate division TM6 bacterium GW2011_GWF2_28_16]|nr:MAG: hypothetical protein SZ59_C0001G0081 [candidate division TM6 bacterium GW2011_GWF2_28_16]